MILHLLSMAIPFQSWNGTSSLKLASLLWFQYLILKSCYDMNINECILLTEQLAHIHWYLWLNSMLGNIKYLQILSLNPIFGGVI